MTTAPPRLARTLLVLLAPPGEEDWLAGDLDEEFHEHVVPTRGVRQARRWYRGQVLRSAVPLLLLLGRRGEALRTILLAQILVAVPLGVAHAFWSRMLWLVPLRADHVAPVAGMLTVALLACIAAAGACQVARRSALPLLLLYTASVGIVALLGARSLDVTIFASSPVLLASLPLSAVAGGSLGLLRQSLSHCGRTL